MNLLPCDFIKSIDGNMGALGLIGLPLAAAGALLHVLSQWPGQILWLIAGLLRPWRISRGVPAAIAVAIGGFFA